MITVDAQFDKGQLKQVLHRLSLVQKAVHYYIDSPAQLPRKLALYYVANIRMFIMYQKFMSNYQGYNPDYAAWKQKYGKGRGFWNLYGDLVTNLSVFRKGRDWFGGISYYAMDSGNKSWFGEGDKGKVKRIAMYGSVMEEGIRVSTNRSGVHPARPLFTPVLKDFASSQSKATQGQAWTISEKMLMIVGDYWSTGIARRTL
jgi:hypothetical protein